MKYLMTRHPIFQNLAKVIVANGEEAFLASFSLSENYYKNFTEVVYFPKLLKKAENYSIDDEEILQLKTKKLEMAKRNGIEIKKEYIIKMKKYLWLLDKYIEDKGIDTVIVYTGSSMIEQLLLYLVKEKSLETIFIEEGYFRPDTVTVDLKGINYNSSIPREVDFYKNYNLKEETADKFSIDKNVKKMKKIKRKVVNYFGMYLGYLDEHKVNSLSGYIKQEYYLDRFRRSKTEKFDYSEEYIFIPFQVHSDTQILFHSPKINDMEELVEVCMKGIREYNRVTGRNLKAVFKEHPKDIGLISYKEMYKKYEKDSDIIFLKKADMNKLIDNSQMVITINSTVGIESLIKNKKVIVLGNAFYDLEGITFNCKNPVFLSNVIEDAFSRELDADLVKKYLNYLRYEYNVEGYLGNENDETAREIYLKIKKEIR